VDIKRHRQLEMLSRRATIVIVLDSALSAEVAAADQPGLLFSIEGRRRKGILLGEGDIKKLSDAGEKGLSP